MRLFLWVVLFGVFLSCDPTDEITDEMLDGKLLFDSSLLFPELYLTSVKHPEPTAEEAARPVLIMCHGYSGSTFEWKEFVDWSAGGGEFYISQVLLEGHGRTYEDFRASSWQDWQQSIFDEYEKLMAAGYTNIHFIASSTSGALLLEALASGYFDRRSGPASISMVDPIVIPSSKILSLIGFIGPLIGYTSAENTDGEQTYWYTYRPQETLQELQELIGKVRKQLQGGVDLPHNSRMYVYKSIRDPTADAVSAVLIHKGIVGNLSVTMVDSDLHVYTRLKHRRETLTQKDYANQLATFQSILQTVITP